MCLVFGSEFVLDSHLKLGQMIFMPLKLQILGQNIVVLFFYSAILGGSFKKIDEILKPPYRFYI